jgi:beta-1,4-mannooligosaccharide/beta-1,4-mannosyl-N-acetylglucosamine phosphorylase
MMVSTGLDRGEDGPDGLLPAIPWRDREPGDSSLVWRFPDNPIIGRNPTPSTARVFNSAVVRFDGAFAGVFRADHRHGRPGLHVGFSTDGLDWTINDHEIEWLDENGNLNQPGYAYDPRVVLLGGIHYITWCTDAGGPALGLGRTKDFQNFTRMEDPLPPFNRNGVLFPRRINGSYVLLHRPSDNGHTPFGDIYLSHSPDLTHWGGHRLVMRRSSVAWWQNLKIGAGPSPIETPSGWLLMYHGVTGTCSGYVYSMGAALLDLDHPERVLARTCDYLLTPEQPYETSGFVPNVVFPCAALQQDDRLAIYYGSADTCVGLAFGFVSEIVEHLVSPGMDLSEHVERT